MDTWVWIVIAVAAAIVLLGFVSATRTKRARALRETFGPEVDGSGVENDDDVTTRDEAKVDMRNVQRLR